MANTNSKISTVVSSQLPFFVRNDHPNFVAFLEAYYEYLEQSNTTLQFGKTTERTKNLLGYMDIDNTLDDFSDILFQRFLALIPKDLQADKKLVLKNAKDFYRSTGSEKSIRFLMRVLFNEEIEFYYPKSDVLRASDGKWYVEKTLRVTEEGVNGVANSSTAALEKFISRKITGNTSNASAKVESVSRFFDKNVRVDELVISEVKGVFKAGETIRSYFDEATETKMVTGRVFGGIFNGVKIINPGTSYVKGTNVPVVTTDEEAGGASIIIDKVSTGNISAVTVISNDYGYIDGGAGYRVGDFLAISDPEGLGANAYVSTANTDQTYHQNTYNIIYTTIESIANANINNINYGLYFSGFTDPANANTTLINSLSYWVFSNAGPARLITVTEPGAGYISPTIGVFGNTAIKSLGILGRMEIVDGGVGYAVGNQIEFINYPDTYGYAGRGNVTNVAANGRIQQVKFIPYGEVPGGLGYSYDQLPVANVISSTGTGANIVVTAIIGTGGRFKEANSVIGRIERLTIVAGGSSYTAQNTSLDMTTSGDGTAVLEPILLEGIITKPGRYINDDGHLSSFNFLQDRDYYQNHSFVLKVKQSIDDYKNILRDLVQPAGTKLFGEHAYVSQLVNSQVSIANTADANQSYRRMTVDNRSYNIANVTGNSTFTITMNTSSQLPNSELYLEFATGNVASMNANGFYYVKSVTNTNSLIVYNGAKIPSSINVAAIGETTIQDLYFRNDGRMLYIIGSVRQRAILYDLIYPWDISSAVYRTVGPSVGDQSTAIQLSPDGDNYYVLGYNNKRVNQYSINVGNTWNVNTSVLVGTYSVADQEGLPTGMTFSTDGTRMYVVGTANSKVIMYNVATPWQVNTSIYMANVSIVASEAAPFGLYFKDDGKQLYFTGPTSDRIFQYTLSNAWNIQTATYNTRSLAITSIDTAPQGLSFSSSGNTVYIAVNASDEVLQLPVSEAWNAATIIVDTMLTTSNTGLLSVSKQIT